MADVVLTDGGTPVLLQSFKNAWQGELLRLVAVLTAWSLKSVHHFLAAPFIHWLTRTNHDFNANCGITSLLFNVFLMYPRYLFVVVGLSQLPKYCQWRRFK